MVIFKNANSQSGPWILIPVLSGELINYPPSKRVKYKFVVFVFCSVLPAWYPEKVMLMFSVINYITFDVQKCHIIVLPNIWQKKNTEVVDMNVA